VSWPYEGLKPPAGNFDAVRTAGGACVRGDPTPLVSPAAGAPGTPRNVIARPLPDPCRPPAALVPQCLQPPLESSLPAGFRYSYNLVVEENGFVRRNRTVLNNAGAVDTSDLMREWSYSSTCCPS
jgi:hypothetical protein